MATSATTDDPSVRRRRTFKPRRRSLSSARAELFDRLAPRFALDEHGPAARSRRRVRATGADGARHRHRDRRHDAGDGDRAARARRDRVRRAHARHRRRRWLASSEHGLDNVRLVHGDALEFVERLRRGSLAGMRVVLPRPVAEGAPPPPAAGPRRRRRPLRRRCCDPADGSIWRPTSTTTRRRCEQCVRRPCRAAREDRSSGQPSARSPATSARASRPATLSSISGTTRSTRRRRIDELRTHHRRRAARRSR